jgi:hypothetical protein
MCTSDSEYYSFMSAPFTFRASRLSGHQWRS